MFCTLYTTSPDDIVLLLLLLRPIIVEYKFIKLYVATAFIFNVINAARFSLTFPRTRATTCRDASLRALKKCFGTYVMLPDAGSEMSIVFVRCFESTEANCSQFQY